MGDRRQDQITCDRRCNTGDMLIREVRQETGDRRQDQETVDWRQ